MLLSNQFVEAEDRYRRGILCEQYQSAPTNEFGKVLLLAFAGALFLAACGDSGDSNSGAAEPTHTEVTNESVLEGNVLVVPADEKTPEEVFSGVPAPDWHPKLGPLPVVEHTGRLSGPR